MIVIRSKERDRQVREEAFEEGWNEGRKFGKIEGYREGYPDGIIAGRAEVNDEFQRLLVQWVGPMAAKMMLDGMLAKDRQIKEEAEKISAAGKEKP